MYYHVNYADFAIGEIIQPGGWGRQIRQFRPGGPMPTPETLAVLLWEVAMESARVIVDPKLCSRLHCTFVWETIELAVSFRNQTRPNAHIFELEATSDNPTYRGDFSLITHNNPTQAYADYMSETCKKYWTTPASEAPGYCMAAVYV
ncbi:hypothetical protein [Agrobacterium sp.]|uniref:hypothetical protein n=1 Tax=Agrobacterium sp. TaxID=361 RepID=UPI0028A7B413|nr:hypothetical protein [Agrobacterium sp.]